MKLNSSNAAIIKRLLVGRKSRPLLSILNRLEPADLASLFNTLNHRETHFLHDALMSIDKASITLLELPEPQLESVLAILDFEELLPLITYADEEDAAYFLTLIREDRRLFLLEKLEAPKRSHIQQFLQYPEDTAGRIMQRQVFSLELGLTAAEGISQIRQKAQELSIYYIYVTNSDKQLIGVVSLRALATALADTPLEELLKRELVTVKPDTPSDEVARLVGHYDFVAVPVIDSDSRLIGVITVDDVLDIIQEQATANIYAQAGLQEDDRIYTPAGLSIRHRMPWMLLNLLLAALASSVVSLFEQTMSQLIILASLKNIVAGMGGNTAIQSLTVVTRGMAVGDFKFSSKAKVIFKEATVGVTIGLLTGLCAGVLTYFWKEDLMVSIVIFISMLLNSLVASLAGSIIPLALKRGGWDPAVGSGVLVTMITDIFGFFSFLGIASLGLYFFT